MHAGSKSGITSNFTNDAGKASRRSIHSPFTATGTTTVAVTGYETVNSNNGNNIRKMNKFVDNGVTNHGDSSNNSSSSNSIVAHPQAVKPKVSKGKSRGPRSQSGKNV
uniref:Uncharacterized protein n=1 Tax=Lygus hesperus TaxID=30085 RepID=A0A0A9VPC7_LYGHE